MASVTINIIFNETRSRDEKGLYNLGYSVRVGREFHQGGGRGGGGHYMLGYIVRGGQTRTI